MAFTIPNQADAGTSSQSELDAQDIAILVAAYNGDGVVTGGAVTAQGTPDMTVAVAAGTVMIAGTHYAISAGNATIGTADSSNPRFDLISINTSGALVVTAGTAASNPVFPSLPSNTATLAAVHVPAGDTAIATAQITDKRVIARSPGVPDDAILWLGTTGDAAVVHKSGSLSADATLTNVVEGSPDHLGTAANSLLVSNITNDGDIMFLVSDGGNSKGLLKLCGANGRTVFHGGDVLISGTQKLYFNDAGGEYISGDGSTLTITGTTALTPSIGSTAWTNANHAHSGSCSGGAISLGTLTSLQVDFINANASTLTITDSTDTGDLASLAVTTHGATTLTTTDDDAAAAHFTVDADGNITLDSATGIVTIEDGGTEVLRFTESCSGDVTVKLVTNGKDLIFTDNGDAEGFRILDAAAGVNVAGLLTAGSLDIDNVLINGTTIGHTCDTDLMTVGNACLTIKGAVTVGVDDTGHDVKFFGATTGAFMLYDQSCNLLEIRGATAAGPGHLKLTTGETTVVANDVLGRIDFQAPLEADCSADARLVGASIAAVAQGTFADALNATDIVFYTGHSETAVEKIRITSQGEIGIFTSCAPNYGNDGQVLTSAGAGNPVAWECGGVGSGPLRIASGAACAPAYSFSTSTDTNTGMWRPGCDILELIAGGGGSLRIDSNAKVFIKDTANCKMGRGLTIQQGGYDNEILALKSCEVAHNICDIAEPDTYGSMKKTFPDGGGLTIYGITDGNGGEDTGITLTPVSGTGADTAHTACGEGLLTIDAGVKGSGTAIANAAGGGNLVVIRDLASTNAKFIVDQEGDLFLDATLNASHYDSFCDAQLTRALSTTIDDATKDYDMYGNLIPQSDREPSQIIKNKWDEFTTYNEQSLIDAGILGGPVVGVNLHNRGLVNVSQLQRLHNGAIWQLHSKLNDQAEDITALKGQLQALQEGK